MFGLLSGVVDALLALMVVGAGVVGAILWLVAKLLPALAGPLYAVSFVLTGVTITLGIVVLIETLSRDTVTLHPIYTVGVPGACGFLALATWGIRKIHCNRRRMRRQMGRTGER